MRMKSSSSASVKERARARYSYGCRRPNKGMPLAMVPEKIEGAVRGYWIKLVLSVRLMNAKHMLKMHDGPLFERAVCAGGVEV